MITDTKAGQTNYCPNCEDQARRIEELERHNKMMADVLGTIHNEYLVKGYIAGALAIGEILHATPAQSEAWEWNQHVEWIKKNLRIEATHCDVREERFFFEDDIKRLQRLPAGTQLVAIPELKEVKE